MVYKLLGKFVSIVSFVNRSLFLKQALFWKPKYKYANKLKKNQINLCAFAIQTTGL